MGDSHAGEGNPPGPRVCARGCGRVRVGRRGRRRGGRSGSSCHSRTIRATAAGIRVAGLEACLPGGWLGANSSEGEPAMYGAEGLEEGVELVVGVDRVVEGGGEGGRSDPRRRAGGDERSRSAIRRERGGEEADGTHTDITPSSYGTTRRPERAGVLQELDKRAIRSSTSCRRIGRYCWMVCQTIRSSMMS